MNETELRFVEKLSERLENGYSFVISKRFRDIRLSHDSIIVISPDNEDITWFAGIFTCRPGCSIFDIAKALTSIDLSIHQSSPVAKFFSANKWLAEFAGCSSLEELELRMAVSGYWSAG